jgi:hypothetical protein
MLRLHKFDTLHVALMFGKKKLTFVMLLFVVEVYVSCFGRAIHKSRTVWIVKFQLNFGEHIHWYRKSEYPPP